jgi:hypothetical protein
MCQVLTQENDPFNVPVGLKTCFVLSLSLLLARAGIHPRLRCLCEDAYVPRTLNPHDMVVIHELLALLMNFSHIYNHFLSFLVPQSVPYENPSAGQKDGLKFQ